MKHISKMIAVTMIVMICIFGLTTTAFAEETQSETGLQASIVTDKESYAAKEQIKVDFKVRNTNGYDINNVVMNASIPSDYTVKDGASTSKTLSTLQSSSEDGFSLVLVANDQGGNTSNGAENKSGTSPKTGDTRNIAIIVIALAASGTVIFLNRKRLIKGISVSLCIAICLTTAAVVGVPSASAAEIDKITVSKTFTVDNVEHTITLIVSSDKHVSGGVNLTGYKMSEASGYIDDNLYADVEDLSHVKVDSDTLISYFDNEISFMVKDGVTERDVVDKIINKYDAVIVGKSTVTGRYLIRFNNDTYSYNEIAKIQEELSKNPLVDAAYHNYAIEMEDDAFYPQGDLWSDSYGIVPEGNNWGMEAINAPQAWDYYNIMQKVDVGVFEAYGLYSSHPDIINVLSNVRMDNENSDLDHGTHVSGIIGAAFNNQIGVNGVCPTARISYIDSYNGSILTRSTFSECNAFEYLITKCNSKVINMSAGYRDEVAYAASGYGDTMHTARAKVKVECDAMEITDTLSCLLKNENYDFLICASAGNGNNQKYSKNSRNSFGYTKDDEIDYSVNNINAEYDSFICAIKDSDLKKRIIVVGSVQNDDNGQYSLAFYSNVGDRVDVVAPGTNIHSTMTPESNYYGLLMGTSMASPHVAGIAAILYSLNPNLTGSEVKDIICSTATTPVDGTDKKMVNAEAAVKKLLENDYYSEPCKFSYNSQIVDIDTNQPISDVKVTVTSHLLSGDVLHTQTVKSNNNGYVNFKEFAGNCDITFEKDGYETVKVTNKYDKGVMYTNLGPVGMKKIKSDDVEVLKSLPSEFHFASGVGGWRTVVTIKEDGTFVGNYTGNQLTAPIGICNFTGKFTDVKRIDEYTYSMKMNSLEQEGIPGDVYSEDGKQYEIGTPYGFDNADEFMLYLPGKPISELSDEFLSWVQIKREARETLPQGIYGLYNVNEKYGFSGRGNVNPLWESIYKHEYNKTRSELQPSSYSYSHLTFWPETGAAGMNLVFYWKKDDQTEFEATETNGGGTYKLRINFNADHSKAQIELEGDKHTNLTFWGGTTDGKFSGEYILQK